MHYRKGNIETDRKEETKKQTMRIKRRERNTNI